MRYVYYSHDQDTLCHHGIKGQRWGVRRFQDVSGALTDAGRKRYGQAKKLAKFGVALAKAKGEQYSKEAQDKYIDARNKTVNAYRHAFKDDDYYTQNQQRIWDYLDTKGKLKSDLNEKEHLMNIAKAKRDAEIARDVAERRRDVALKDAARTAKINSDARYQRRDESSGWGLIRPGVPKDILSMSLSELESRNGAYNVPISTYGARYIANQAKLDTPLRWQDYFEPATYSSYNPYEY